MPDDQTGTLWRLTTASVFVDAVDQVADTSSGKARRGRHEAKDGDVRFWRSGAAWYKTALAVLLFAAIALAGWVA